MEYKIYQFSFGDGYAGSAKMAILSSLVLTGAGHDVTLFVSNSSLTEKRATEKNIKIISLNSDQKYSDLLAQIIQIVGKNKPDFCITYHSLDRKIGNSLKSNFKKQIINIAYRQNMSKSIPIIGSLIYNRYCDLTLACSQGVANDLIKSGIRKKDVRVIYNVTDYPKDINRITGESIRQQYQLQNKYVIGVSSWFHKERKGFDILFRVFAKLDAKFILMIIGIPIEMQPQVIEYASSFGIAESSLIMPGFVENVYEFYKAMNVFVLPSRSEGFSLALLEAGASALPIVASNIPGNNEFMKHLQNGLLFDIDKSDDLFDTLKFMFDHKELAQKMGEQASLDAMQNFNLSVYQEKLNKLLTEIFNIHKK